MRRRFTSIGMLGLALVAMLAIGVAPASAKKAKKVTVTRTATINQCVNVTIPYSETTPAAVALNPVTTVPTFRGLPQDGTVTAITSVGVRISHTFVSDNVIRLLTPGGRLITLFQNNDNGTDDFGTGATNCGGTQTLFSDTAGTAIAAGAPPYAGSFRPVQPLSQANGGPARGLWTLIVDDDVAADSGTVHAFSLNFTYTYLALQKKKKKK
jgi:subtilisin-like proprotein convertase family protein